MEGIDQLKKIVLPSGRHFIFYAPPSRSAKLPLILFYHGKLGTAEKYIKKSHWIQKADELKYAICFLQAQGSRFS
jgi:poly(3-hydroxybutyrate) depolymerase